MYVYLIAMRKLDFSRSENYINTHFEFQHKIHPLLPERVDVIEDESDDDVDTVALMSGNAVLRKR